jgi:hypothetical protein
VPTQQQLKELYDYEPETGHLIHLRDINHAVKCGSPAGYIRGDGYRSIRLGSKAYTAHRLVWWWHGNTIGEGEVIDHINGDRTDNHIENLRSVPRAENCRNLKLNKLNRSGFLGVSFHPACWKAEIKFNRRTIPLGKFETKDEAIAARKTAEAKYGYHPNHGRSDATIHLGSLTGGSHGRKHF